jgi:hypothetical protein
MRAEFRQQPVGTGRLAGCIDKPGERRGKLHGAIMMLTHDPCHEQSCGTGFHAAVRAPSPEDIPGGIDD